MRKLKDYTILYAQEMSSMTKVEQFHCHLDGGFINLSPSLSTFVSNPKRRRGAPSRLQAGNTSFGFDTKEEAGQNIKHPLKGILDMTLLNVNRYGCPSFQGGWA